MPETDDLEGRVRDYIREQVTAGFYDAEDIIESTEDYFSDELEEAPQLEEQIKTITLALFKDHLAQQAHWPEATDCDRLDAAFGDLEARGILARQNFTCCGTCGAAESYTLLTDARSEGRELRGYTFYHQQDTEHAAQGNGVYLNYGAHEDSEEAALAIAAEVVKVLHEHGLKTTWDGSHSKRIFVHMLWQRRWQPPDRITAVS